MRPGGAKAKGNAFERLVCVALSLWVTEGHRADVFTRNIISGGKFSVQSKKDDELGMPGDIAASHPMAFQFLSLISVECKHRKSIDLVQYILDEKGTSFLSKVIAHTSAQAQLVGLRYMVIARENNRPAIVLMDRATADVAMQSVTGRRKMPHHVLHSGTVMLVKLDAFVDLVRPKLFLEGMNRLRNIH